MGLTIREIILIGCVFFTSVIVGIVIKYKDIENNTVRHCCTDSVKKMETKKPPNWKGK